MVDFSKTTVNYRGKVPVTNWYLTLDIETSDDRTATVEPSYGWSYQQGLCVYDYVNDELVMYKETRNILDMVSMLVDISCDLTDYNPDAVIYCFIHNLTFDLTFFRQALRSAFQYVYENDTYDELHTSAGTLLRASINNIEFRDSYSLYNSSLYAFTKDMAVAHRKLVGNNDYGTHFSDEILPETFTEYQYNDVVGLAEAVCKLGHTEGMRLANLPYTFTGFNRKALSKEFIRTEDKQRVHIDEIHKFEKSKPGVREYAMLKKARHGGFAMAMPMYKGKDIQEPMAAFDYRSLYPACMVLFDYPSGRGKRILCEAITKAERQACVLNAIKHNELAVMTLAFKRPRLVKAIPFMQSDDDLNTYDCKMDVELYQGRIIKADLGEYYVYTTVTTPDARILFNQYTYDDWDLIDAYVYDSEPMSEVITDRVKKLFRNKQQTKIDYKNADFLSKPEAARKMVLAKTRLNSIAGLLQEAPIRNEYILTEDSQLIVKTHDVSKGKYSQEEYEYARESLSQHYNGYKHGKCFNWVNGIFMLAYARELLFKAFDASGQDNVVYGDTDSDKCIKTPDLFKNIERLNNSIIELAKLRGAYCTIDCKDYYMGVLELEEDDITRFKAISPKMYLSTNDKTLKATITGIKYGVGQHEELVNGEMTPVFRYTREMEICGIPFDNPRQPNIYDINRAFNNFKNGFTFKYCSGTTSSLIKNDPCIMNIRGHEQFVADSISIFQAERTVYEKSKTPNSSLLRTKLDEHDYTQDVVKQTLRPMVI